MKVAFHPIFVHELPENHRFPMQKYELLYEQLLYEGTIEQSQVISCSNIDLDYVRLAHDQNYLDNLINLNITASEQRVTGFKHDLQLIDRELHIMEGTRKLTLEAVNSGVGLNIAGGTHHAFSNRGEGFCLLNDFAIAARFLQSKKLANNVLIIDLDVHQGNGTAEIFSNDKSVFTFSMHGQNNYPLKKEHSSLDVALPDGTDDKAYLYALEKNLDHILNAFTPDFIFYQCGVDVLRTDKLGRLSMTIEGVKKRDTIVFNCAHQINVPMVCAMGGGYSPEVNLIVEAHANTFRVAAETFT